MVQKHVDKKVKKIAEYYDVDSATIERLCFIMGVDRTYISLFGENQEDWFKWVF